MNADKIASNENTALDEKSRIVETIRAIDDFYRQADELYRQTAWRMGLPDCAFDIVYALVNEDGLTRSSCASSDSLRSKRCTRLSSVWSTKA